MQIFLLLLSTYAEILLQIIPGKNADYIPSYHISSNFENSKELISAGLNLNAKVASVFLDDLPVVSLRYTL